MLKKPITYFSCTQNFCSTNQKWKVVWVILDGLGDSIDGTVDEISNFLYERLTAHGQTEVKLSHTKKCHFHFNEWDFHFPMWHFHFNKWHFHFHKFHFHVNDWHFHFNEWHFKIHMCHIHFNMWHFHLHKCHFHFNTWHFHTQVTEPEFVRFCVLDPQLGDSVVRIFRAMIRKHFATQYIVKLNTSEKTKHGIFLATARSQFFLTKTIFQSLGASCLSAGRPVFFFNRRSHQRWANISVQQIDVLEGPILGQVERDNLWDGVKPLSS